MAEGFFRRLLGNRKDIERVAEAGNAVRGQLFVSVHGACLPGGRR